MPAEVAKIPEGSFVVLMTMGHTTDKPILLEILRTRKFPYLGVIGSNSKAKRLREDVLAAGLPPELTAAFHCPIGLEIGSNHPQEIAISVAAQMLQVRG
jgi:xanthine dehydrogenase accessory factor